MRLQSNSWWNIAAHALLLECDGAARCEAHIKAVVDVQFVGDDMRGQIHALRQISV